MRISMGSLSREHWRWIASLCVKVFCRLGTPFPWKNGMHGFVGSKRQHGSLLGLGSSFETWISSNVRTPIFFSFWRRRSDHFGMGVRWTGAHVLDTLIIRLLRSAAPEKGRDGCGYGERCGRTVTGPHLAGRWLWPLGFAIIWIDDCEIYALEKPLIPRAGRNVGIEGGEDQKRSLIESKY